MKSYSNKADAIADLHEQGFTNDFRLSGNDLLWIQERVLIRVGEFVIVEYHKIEESVIFGIIALHHNIKGIVLSRTKDRQNDMSPVLKKKLNELNIIKPH